MTTAPGRDYAISDGGFDHLLAQFRDLAGDYLEAALQNRHHGFSNIRETLQETASRSRQGVSVRRRASA